MILTSNLGYPRIGLKRELKSALEAFWNNESDLGTLLSTSQEIQKANWQLQASKGIDFIPSNDFSLYDHVLDTAIMVNAIPSRFRSELFDNEIANYFAMARGFQKNDLKIPAMEMTKWFNTNYHFIVPELSSDTRFKLNEKKIVESFDLAKSIGIETRPVILGPVTFLLLSKTSDNSFRPIDKLEELIPVYQQLLEKLQISGVRWIQLDEPFLVSELSQELENCYTKLFESLDLNKKRPKILLTSYFDDISINRHLISKSPFEGLHIDLSAINNPYLFFSDLPKFEAISLGLIDGRNIWKSNLNQTAEFVKNISLNFQTQDILLSPTCSMIHIPQDVNLEKELDPEVKSKLSFSQQKLDELALLRVFISKENTQGSKKMNNQMPNKNPIGKFEKAGGLILNTTLPDSQIKRKMPFSQRKKYQKFSLPIFPTTTIGSFPQTIEIRKMRAKFNHGEIDSNMYENFIRNEIEKVIRLQEEIGLDVLVHGEFERNDMVQYFAEKMDGFAFTQHGWVQSFGSRYVRPPIIYGTVSRPKPISISWIKYTQSLTSKPVKGMLTGPVTILQWSFVRDDQPRSVTCREIAFAIRKEVLDLESEGIQIIQIDEPALREGLPIQKSGWEDYLSWAVECFKISSGGVKNETQIHTHMCYAEFNEIIDAISEMDADVISIEASRSNMELLKSFHDFQYPNDIGPGIYDIHSPNVPRVEELVDLLEKALVVIPDNQLWVNPDCGLKTRKWDEVIPSLKAMVAAAKILRQKMDEKNI